MLARKIFHNHYPDPSKHIDKQGEKYWIAISVVIPFLGSNVTQAFYGQCFQ
jgi:hypothetical protein